jgi:5-formyltetrahydrofolate cyclo-ligase
MQIRSHHLEPSGSRAALSAVLREPLLSMTDSHSRKTALRSALRQRRRSLNSSAQRIAAESLARSVLELPCWKSAQRIAVYHARDGEIETVSLANMARKAAKRLFLPVLCDDKSLSFARWDPDDTPSINRYQIPEPPETAERCPANELDIIFLPVVGWDARGGRLGMGGGYYDRTLSGISGPVLVGLAHECQQVADIPRENWDIVLDYVATDAAIYRRQGSYNGKKGDTTL